MKSSSTPVTRHNKQVIMPAALLILVMVLASPGPFIGTAENEGLAAPGVERPPQVSDHAARAAKHMLVLLDRSGSMNEYRLNGNTRTHDSVALAKCDVEDFFIANPTGAVAVWYYNNTEITQLTAGFVDEAEAVAAINSLSTSSGTGTTPLAEAICEACDYLVNSYPTTSQAERILL
ncbi:MAG: vWA domain-containing protein, partial [bacterium]